MPVFFGFISFLYLKIIFAMMYDNGGITLSAALVAAIVYGGLAFAFNIGVGVSVGNWVLYRGPHKHVRGDKLPLRVVGWYILAFIVAGIVLACLVIIGFSPRLALDISRAVARDDFSDILALSSPLVAYAVTVYLSMRSALWDAHQKARRFFEDDDPPEPTTHTLHAPVWQPIFSDGGLLLEWSSRPLQYRASGGDGRQAVCIEGEAVAVFDVLSEVSAICARDFLDSFSIEAGARRSICTSLLKHGPTKLMQHIKASGADAIAEKLVADLRVRKTEKDS